MWWLTLIISAVIITGFPFGIFVLVWKWLAPTNRFFTFVGEKKAKTVLRGERVERVLVPDGSYRVNGRGNLVNFKRNFLPWGLSWVGIWPIYDIGIYEFTWARRVQQDDGSWHLEIKTEDLDYVYYERKFIYPIVLADLEDKDGLPLTLVVDIGTEITNPYKAIYGGSSPKWLRDIANYFSAFLRDKIKERAYFDLKSESGAIGGTFFEGSEIVCDTTREQLGVNIYYIGLADISPPEGYRKATLKEWEAQQEAKAVIAEAHGDAQATITRAKADAQAVKIKAKATARSVETVYPAVKEQGPAGLLLRLLSKDR